MAAWHAALRLSKADETKWPKWYATVLLTSNGDETGGPTAVVPTRVAPAHGARGGGAVTDEGNGEPNAYDATPHHGHHVCSGAGAKFVGKSGHFGE